MPIRKPRVSREKAAIYSDCLRQLQAEGLDLEILDEWLENSRALDIVLAGPAENTVLEIPGLVVVYMVHVCLVALRPVTLAECGLSTEYDDQIVLGPYDERSSVYRVCGLPQGEVLNQRFENDMRLSRGQVVRGWLVATGLRLVPSEYGKSAVPFQAIFRDQFGNEHLQEGKLSVERMSRPESTRRGRGTGLDGESAFPTPSRPSIEEESRLRYLGGRRSRKKCKEPTTGVG
jgi:hypothetical protein